MNAGLILIAVVGYAIGCFPTAWIVLKLTSGKDIRLVGTGNVGAHNTYDVTGSTWLAVLVGITDALKGVVAVLVARLIHGDWFAAVAVAGAMAVLGHNWNVLLRFKGGRGLATAAGVFALVDPFFLAVWGVMYLTGYYVIRRNVHVGSMTAILGTAILAWSMPERVLRLTPIVVCYEPIQLSVFIGVVSAMLFIKHIEPIREFLRTMSVTDGE